MKKLKKFFIRKNIKILKIGKKNYKIMKKRI